jgi:hypothetical protein
VFLIQSHGVPFHKPTSATRRRLPVRFPDITAMVPPKDSPLPPRPCILQGLFVDKTEGGSRQSMSRNCKLDFTPFPVPILFDIYDWQNAQFIPARGVDVSTRIMEDKSYHMWFSVLYNSWLEGRLPLTKWTGDPCIMPKSRHAGRSHPIKYNVHLHQCHRIP